MSFTIQQLEQLKAKGLIRNYSVTKDAKTTTVKIKTGSRGNKTKEWISKNLWAWARANNLEIRKEFEFDDERKWRFDWCFPSMLVAIEYEGLMSAKSRHTTVTGFTGDTEKYNTAQALGWKVLRYTALNYKDMIEDLNKLA